MWILKFTVSQEGSNGINWFFACWCKFRKAKSYCNKSGQNGHGYLAHGTIKYFYLKNISVNWTDFLLVDTNLGKLTLIIIGWVWSKMGMPF